MAASSSRSLRSNTERSSAWGVMLIARLPLGGTQVVFHVVDPEIGLVFRMSSAVPFHGQVGNLPAQLLVGAVPSDGDYSVVAEDDLHASLRSEPGHHVHG